MQKLSMHNLSSRPPRDARTHAGKMGAGLRLARWVRRTLGRLKRVGGARGRLRRIPAGALSAGTCLALLVLLPPRARAGQWQQGASAFARGSFMGTEVDSAGQLSLSSFVGTNLAFGSIAAAGEYTLTGSRSVTDGDPSTEWRFNNEAEVLGKWIRVDLGGDRGVSRIRVVPGKTYQQRPRFYLKGYRMEIAAEETPDDWILVAQQIDNRQPTVDTTRDSTWVETGPDGEPLPVLGRYVRLKVMREDPPNWVSIGEIEVYGEGFRAEGTFESAVFDAGRPINVGQVRFAGTAPRSTELSVQLRSSADNEQWAAWHRVPQWTLADGETGVAGQEPEPARYLQTRVSMETFHPLRTPTLDTLTVHFDEQLYAQRVTGQIEPLRPVLGAETVFTYTLEAEVAPQDLGFDRLRLDLPGTVQEVRLNGAPLLPGAYTASWSTAALELVLDPAYTIRADARLAIDFHSVLLAPTLAVRAGVAMGQATNYQHAAPASEEAWTLAGRGIIGGALPEGSVQIAPNPFNARRGVAQIRVDLAKLQVAQPVTAAVYDLAGRQVRRLWNAAPMTAGRKRLEWDGRTDTGALVPPGHYLLRIDVDANVGDSWIGLVGVGY